uniref:zinc-ribbon domain-containing protein n=1 Tax=Acetatifactor sp. TaxID=1872090 RepID=UPI0040564B0F
MKNEVQGKILINEWNQEKNTNDFGMSVNIQEITYNLQRKMWWKCKSCGNDFQMSPANRTVHGYGCPTCGHKRGGIKNHLNSLQNGNDLYSWCRENGRFGKKLMEEWDVQKNMDLLGIGMADISCGCGNKVYWVCSRCGESFESSVSHRTLCGSGCRHCNKFSTSFPEQLIYHALKQLCPDTISRGKAFDNVEYDICIPSEKLYIEYNGQYWHRNRTEKDVMKRKTCDDNNVRFIQIDAYNTGVDWEVSENIIRYRISYSRHLSQLRQIIDVILNKLGRSIEEIDWDKALDDAYKVMFDEVENNITITHPELLKEWHSEKNGNLKPEYFTAGSNQKVFWKCYKCGNIWEVAIKSRISFGTGCSRCGYNIFDGKIHYSAKNKKKGTYIVPGAYNL